jgi:hypothetical protein
LFREFPVRWVLWWIIMPNIGAILLLPVGGPNVAWPMTICGVLALLVSCLRNAVLRRVGLGVIFVLSAALYVSVSFNLGAERAFWSLRYLLEINPRQSPEYIVAGVVLAAALILTLYRGTHIERPRGFRQVLLAITGLAMLINVDSMATAGLRGSYKMAAPAGTPFDSAVRQAHLVPAATTGKRNVIVVMVESMGLPLAPHDRQLFDRIWNRRAWSARYDVSNGSTPYFGSTTTGEMRELCGLWADYTEVDFKKADCLPERFRTAGYETTAVHSYERTMFDRQAWYPRIGFDRRMFKDDLLDRKARPCDGIFPGVCDRDVPRIIGDQLRVHHDKPQFVYWLTVNSHLPIPRSAQLKTETCDLGSIEMTNDFPMLCRGYELHKQLADALTAEIMRPDFPDADILIVGDHMPPYFQRTFRQRFDAGRVPWILLRRKGGGDTAGSNVGSVGQGPSRQL